MIIRKYSIFTPLKLFLFLTIIFWLENTPTSYAEDIVIHLDTPSYTGAGANFPELRLVKPDEKLTVLRREGDWIRVKDENDNILWMERLTYSKLDRSEYKVSTQSTLNARSGPSAKFEIVSKLKPSSRVKELQREQDWSKVIDQQDQVFWLNNEFIQPLKPALKPHVTADFNIAEWEKAGFTDVIIRDVQIPKSFKHTSEYTHKFEYAAVVLRGSGWTYDEVVERAVRVEEIYSQCDVWLEKIKVITTNPINEEMDFAGNIESSVSFSKKLPTKIRPLIIYARDNEAKTFGFATPKKKREDQHPYINTAWMSFTSKQFEKRVLVEDKISAEYSLVDAHELGHLFLNTIKHTRLEQNLMNKFLAKIGSKLTAEQAGNNLTTEQCERIRSNKELVQEIAHFSTSYAEDIIKPATKLHVERDLNTSEWEKAGFTDVVIGDVKIPKSFKHTSNYTHKFNYAAVVLRGSGWKNLEVAKRAIRVEEIYSQCNVWLEKIKIIATNPINEEMDFERVTESSVGFSKKIPTKIRPLLIYFRHDPGESIAFAMPKNSRKDGHPYINTAWMSVATKEHEKKFAPNYSIDAHELGHLLLNTPEHNGLQQNLMHRYMSRAGSKLSAEQCESIRSNKELVQEISE